MAGASRLPTFRNLNTIGHTGGDSRTGAASVTCRVDSVPAYGKRYYTRGQVCLGITTSGLVPQWSDRDRTQQRVRQGQS